MLLIALASSCVPVLGSPMPYIFDFIITISKNPVMIIALSPAFNLLFQLLFRHHLGLLQLRHFFVILI